MQRMIKIECKNIIKEYPENTPLSEVANSFQSGYNFPIMVAKVDNVIEELAYNISRKCNVDFYDRSSTFGHTVYSHGVHFLMIVAMKKVLGNDAEVIIQHSIDKGVYCEILNKEINKEIIKQIESKMYELVEQDYNFIKLSVSRKDAMDFFRKKKQFDKVNVFKYISNTYINLYRLDEYYDYFFSEMPYSTKVLDEFKLTYIKDNGFVLSYPSIHNPKYTEDYSHHKKIFDAFLDYTNMGKTIGISNAADLNSIVSLGKYNDVIQLAEANYNSQLAKTADIIYNKRNKIKIILLAGPSSSGKTTTARKLEVYLKARGFKTHSISTDDYFLNRVDTPKKPNGDYDFESLRAVDTDLFNKHLLKLLAGEKVLMPEYNFVLGEREYKGRTLQLSSDDIVIIEGIHALNPELTMAIANDNKFKIYISPLTQLNIDNHNRIHTSDTRRLRRIIRDNKYRGWNAADTLRNWKNILEGEEEYVFPYQNEADMIINSALIYELGVLKTYAEPLLFSVDEDDDVYPEAIRLINFLRNFLPIPSDDVPKESVLREFIGGSCFH
ncbi:MAG TPA: nucleoside kinase [Candidatus Faecisoma merdavium]|nr:nucleoside kinase [Candidatus Faecisoma merdavium]